MTQPSPSVEGEITRLLAEDDDIAEHGVTVRHTESGVVLRGCVNSEALRQLILGRVCEAFPDLLVRSEIELANLDPPEGEEEL